jgi:hypothetical protein
MPIEVKNTRDLTNPWLATITYGPPKSGKTTFAASLGEKPMVVDFDDGVLSLKELGVNYVQPRTWEEVLELVANIRSGQLRKTVDYDHIIWDSHTFFYMIVMEGVLRLSNRKQPQIQDWGLANDRVKLVYDQLVKTRAQQRFHFTIVCHERTDKDENTGIILGGINATPQLMAMLPGMFDELYYLTAKATAGSDGKLFVKRSLYTVSSGLFPAGTRSAGKLESIEVPDFKAIYAKIIGGVKK